MQVVSWLGTQADGRGCASTRCVEPSKSRPAIGLRHFCAFEL